MEIKFKKLAENAKMPTKAHESDAGYDLYVSSVNFSAEGTKCYHSGIAMEIPAGYVGLLFPRSSVYKTGMRMANCVGVIDSGYRGDIMAHFRSDLADVHPRTIKDWFLRLLSRPFNLHCICNWNSGENYSVGDRFAQLIIMPYPEVELVEAGELSGSDRGIGGHGSSGK